jgi:hypothetical protein
MKKIVIILILILSKLSYAEKFSMRDCMLLPITDSAGHALGFKVYERLEEHLKDIKWCDYKSSASLLSIFSKYRDKLSAHLNDPAVIRTVADRIRVGTIIRVEIKYLVNNVELKMDVLGENGEDIYFQERINIENGNADNVVMALKKWLELYEVSIPYHGQILGVLGDQITFSIPRHKKYGIGQDFLVKRLTNKSKHKLLKTIVEWNTDTIAKGKIFNISSKQALGVVKVYTSNKKLKAGDWIKLEKISSRILDDKRYPEVNSNKFGKLGTVSIAMNIGNGSVGTSPTGGSVKVSGFTYGLSVDAEAWITRNYFASAEFGRSVGNYKKSSGSPSLETASITSGVLKIGGGYKYLPMGFFYGPQVNLLAGWSKYSYNVESSTTDGFGENSISGFYLGVGGSMPIQKGLRVIGKGEIIPFSSFSDEDNIYGKVKSSGSMYFKVGVQYQYNPVMTLDGGFEVINNSAKFNSGVSQVNYRDSIIKIGTTFVF